MIGDEIEFLVKRLKEDTESLLLPDSEEGMSAPEVYDGFLPRPTRTQKNPKMPFIVARPATGIDNEVENGAYESMTNAILMIACHRTDEDGYSDVLTILNRIRLELLSRPLFGDNRYEVVRPLEWDIGEDEQWPNWYGIIKIGIVTPAPNRLNSIDDEEYIYGSGKPA